MMKTTLVWTMILFTLSLSIGLPHTAAVDTSKWGLPEGAKARLGKGEINEVAYSPDGTLLAVAGSIGIWLYDTETLQERALLTGHTQWVSSVSFSPDGKTIASASSDPTGSEYTVRLWDVATATQKGTLEHTGAVYSVSFSPDGKTIATGSWGELFLWDVATATQKGTLTGHTSAIHSVAFSADGKTIASASNDSTVRLWDVATATHKATLTGHTDLVKSVSFSPDGKTIASGSQDNTVRLWDVATATHKGTLTGHTFWVYSVSFSPDGKTIATGSWGELFLWDVATATQKGTLTGYTRSVTSVTFSPDGKTIASGSQDNTVRLWDVATATHKGTLTGYTGPGSSVSFSPDGKTIASGSGDKVLLWDVATATLALEHTGSGTSVSFNPDGTTLASGSWNSTVLLWDVVTGTLIYTLTGHTQWVSSVSFSPDGRTIASTSYYEDTVRLWDVATATQKATLTGHTSGVSSVAFSPDGKTIASGGNDKTVRLWDVATATQKATLTGHSGDVTSVSFNPDGTTLASGSWEKVLLWDVATATLSLEPTGTGSSVSFSPDGKTIARGSGEGVLLWDVATGTLKHTLTGHTDYVQSVSFSPDGTTLASGSDDGTVLLWDLTLYLDITPEPPDTVDIPGPTIAIRTPSAAQILDHSTPVITGEFSGAASPISLSLTLNDAVVQAEVSDNAFTYMPADALGNGEYTLVAEATDANGNIAETSVVFTVKVPTDDPDSLLTLQSDTFDGSGQDLQPFWQVQNGDKSSWELKDGQLVVDAGFNQNFYFSDTSTRFYQLTNEEQFEVETAMVVEYTPACIVAGIVVYSETGEWVTLKLHLHPNHSKIYAQFQYFVQGRIAGHNNYIETPDGTIPSRAGVFPIQTRIKRDGDEYHTWYRLDAQDDWISAGSTIATLQGPVQTGIYVGICNDESQGGSLKVSFDNFRVTTDAITPVETPEKEDIPYVDATVRFSPAPSESPRVGEQLMLNLNVAGGENITGYQATVQFDETALRYVSSANADFLPADPYIAQPIIAGNTVTVAATSLVGETNGDGTLVTLTFDVISEEVSTLTLTEVLFSDSEGMLTKPHLESVELTITPKLAYPAWDVNEDGHVNILDLVLVGQNIGGSIAAVPRADVNGDNNINILDLVLVAGHFGESTSPAAPVSAVKLEGVDSALVEEWLALAQLENDGSLVFRQGITNLERLLASLIPEETALLANYPNPFNPETWIPYQLAKPAEVSVSIYAADGKLIRTLTLGPQAAGVYHTRSRAAYWNGKNEIGESVASGVYFYTLTAGDFTATRKMLILK